MASVKHKYCLQLSGLCVAQSIKMVTQLMRYGSAVSFIQKYRDNVTEKMLLTWSQQIAEGMDYLESRGIVHRDLAARNILIKSYDHIKITDFGLAKMLDSDEKAFYAKSNSLLPIKWLAIESIQNRIFTHKSDVWSYGVCLWELFTFCAKPYGEIETINIISYIKKGVRLAKPQMASIDVYAILLRCWFEKPYTRPSFKELSEEFEKMTQDPKRYLSIRNVDLSKMFLTINENNKELIENFQDESLDTNVYEYDYEKSSSGLTKQNNNSSLSPDEGIDLNSLELSPNSSEHLPVNQVESNYSESVIVFKRNPQIQLSAQNRSLNSNKSFLRKLIDRTLPKRLDSQLSTATTSSYLSSVYSGSNDSTSTRLQSQNLNDFLNYEEHQVLLMPSSQLPTRSNSSNGSNNSSIYNYRTRPIGNTNQSGNFEFVISLNLKEDL